MSMKVFNKPQILMLTIVALLLTVTPFLSPSFRSTYLYFVTNFLIVALGAEAGLLSTFSKPSDDIQKAVVQGQVIHEKGPSAASFATLECEEKEPIKGDRSASEKIASVVYMDENRDKVKKCPVVPSLFFIGGGENEAEGSEEEKYDEEEVSGGSNEQELSAKAEAFIGNFYRQLKMQREESWKRIHGIYQKGF